MSRSITYEDVNAVVYCKCGCGRKLTLKQKKEGRIYSSLVCSNRVHANERKGKKRGPYDKTKSKGCAHQYRYEQDGVSYKGKSVCLKFENTDINCVMCYEQGLFRKKDCRVIDGGILCECADNVEI